MTMIRAPRKLANVMPAAAAKTLILHTLAAGEYCKAEWVTSKADCVNLRQSIEFPGFSRGDFFDADWMSSNGRAIKRATAAFRKALPLRGEITVTLKKHSRVLVTKK
jgi:hypothetical protein